MATRHKIKHVHRHTVYKQTMHKDIKALEVHISIYNIRIMTKQNVRVTERLNDSSTTLKKALKLNTKATRAFHW